MSQTAAKRAEVAKRRAAAVRMVVEHVPREDIHAALYAGQVNPSAALAVDLSRSLQARTRELAGAVDELRAMQLATLDQLAAEAWRVLRMHHVRVHQGEIIRVANADTGEIVTLEDTAPVLAAIHTLLKIESQRMDLLGTRPPAQLDVEATMRVVVTGVDTRELT